VIALNFPPPWLVPVGNSRYHWYSGSLGLRCQRPCSCRHPAHLLVGSFLDVQSRCQDYRSIDPDHGRRSIIYPCGSTYLSITSKVNSGRELPCFGYFGRSTSNLPLGLLFPGGHGLRVYIWARNAFTIPATSPPALENTSSSLTSHLPSEPLHQLT
jgi:hypothetical protein